MPMNTKPHCGSSAPGRPPGAWAAQYAKFTLVCFFLLFLAGRIGMLLHEFGGHALAWRLLGGKVVDFKLFVFGGGWLYGHRPLAAADSSALSLLMVQLSGIAVELIVGTPLALLAVSRITLRTTRRLAAATSGVLIVHAFFYLVLCAYYGSGDGAALSRILQHGRIREAFLVATVGLTIWAAFMVSYLFSPAIRSWAGGCRRRRGLALIVLGVFSAASLHAVLTAGERIVMKDRTYAEIKTPVNVRLKEKVLAGLVSNYRKRYGREPDQDRIATERAALEAEYGQFPIQIPLAAAVLTALTAGFFFSKRNNHTEGDPITWKDVGWLGGLSAFAVVLILFLNRL